MMNQSKEKLFTMSVSARQQALQAKMQALSLIGRGSAIGYSTSGVVQANVVGGNHALQARLNLWNTRLTRGANPTVVQDQSSNFGPASGVNNPRAIQRKTGPGLEAFRVPLRQKSGGMVLPADVRAKMETAFGADFSD